MNIEKLIEAAKEIERLKNKQEEQTRAWQQLAIDVRGGLDPKERDRRRNQLDAVKVVDFGTAINNLCRALHAPAKKSMQRALPRS